jgi:hypothetical protein
MAGFVSPASKNEAGTMMRETIALSLAAVAEHGRLSA